MYYIEIEQLNAGCNEIKLRIVSKLKSVPCGQQSKNWRWDKSKKQKNKNSGER